MTTALDDRTAWLLERRSGIGGSDIASIGGVAGAYGSPWSIWADKRGFVPLDEQPTPSMQLGHDLEPIIARWFKAETGLDIRGEQTVVHHRREPRWFATVDGFVLEPDSDSIDDACGPFESKFTSEAPWSSLPERFVWQVQWQMACTGHGGAWVGALHLPFGRPEFRVYTVERDDELIARQCALAEHFWADYVETGVPPPADDHRATGEAIAAAWGHLDTLKVPVLDLSEHRGLIDEYADVHTKLLDLTKRDDKLAARVRALFAPTADEDALSEGVVDGTLAVSWRSQTSSRVDVAAVRADHGDQYDRVSTTRVLRLHGRRLA